MTDVLTNRQLNRTLLARQFLLDRTDLPIQEVVDHLIGLQAQDVMPPFIALHSRVKDFQTDTVDTLLMSKKLNRVSIMRGTVHMVGRQDALNLRPIFQPIMEETCQRPSYFFGAMSGIDVEEIRTRAASLFADGPQTTASIRTFVQQTWPDREANPIVQAIYYLLPVQQVPPRGAWNNNSRPVWHLIEQWLDAPLVHNYPREELVLRYLRAFGPASTMDMQTWSRITGFREIVDRLGDRLRTWQDERGRVLYDDAALDVATGDEPAEPRFLGWYDNALLSHQDRTRIIPADLDVVPPIPKTRDVSTFLLDGMVAGAWQVVIEKHTVRLLMRAALPLSSQDTTALEIEAASLLRMMHPEHEHELTFMN